MKPITEEDIHQACAQLEAALVELLDDHSNSAYDVANDRLRELYQLADSMIAADICQGGFWG